LAAAAVGKEGGVDHFSQIGFAVQSAMLCDRISVPKSPTDHQLGRSDTLAFDRLHNNQHSVRLNIKLYIETRLGRIVTSWMPPMIQTMTERTELMRSEQHLKLVSISFCLVLLGCASNEPKAETSQSQAKTSGERHGDSRGDFRSDRAETAADESSRELPASLIRILVYPDRYDGKTVSVAGYLRTEFEGTAIYLSREDEQHMMLCNAVWVSFEGNAMKMDDEKITTEFDGKYVYLSGVFDKAGTGHFGRYQGTIKNITLLRVKPDRSEVKRLRETWLRGRNSGDTNR
jgi:hypothetical protein